MWDDDITEGLSCLTQSELCWFLINCLQEFCFSHSDLFNAFKQFSLFRNSCVVSLRADMTSRFLVSLLTASGSSQGDESLWKSLSGPLSARCRSTVPSASQRLLKKKSVDYFLSALLARMNIYTCSRLKHRGAFILKLLSRSSYFSRSEGGQSCCVSLRVQLLFNDVRCHKINIPFLLCAM